MAHRPVEQLTDRIDADEQPRRARRAARRPVVERSDARHRRETPRDDAKTSAASSAALPSTSKPTSHHGADLGQHRRDLRQMLAVPVQIHGPAVERRRRDLGVAADQQHEHEQRQTRRAPCVRAAPRTTSTRRARATARRARSRARRRSLTHSVGQTFCNVSAAFKTSNAAANSSQCRASSGRVSFIGASRARVPREPSDVDAERPDEQQRAPRARARRSTAAPRAAPARRSTTRSARRKRLAGAGSAAAPRRALG